VYRTIIGKLKEETKKVIGVDSFDVRNLFNDEAPCCSALCDPTDPKSNLLKIPSLSISLAVNTDADTDSEDQVTVEIPPQYIWRPILVMGVGNVLRNCRVFGISEGDITLLGDVFMDGLFTVHDRKEKRIGIALANNCPLGIKSTKKVSISKGKVMSCDCLGDNDRKDSLLNGYFPGMQRCFFWQWWMYIVLISMIIVVICLGIILFMWYKRKKTTRTQQRGQIPTTNGKYALQ
jgi:beta-site APP-cleaving enzyme 2 (memapsin 1)